MEKDLKITNVKNQDQIEQFDYERLKKSIIYACLSARRPEGQAESTAKIVCDGVVDWLKERPEVTSHDIRRITAKILENYDPEAAYLYSQHHITI